MSASTRRCYLLVGSPKTGTSYLQSVMWASRPALADQGLSLPLRGVGDHFRPTLHGDRLLISHELLAPVRTKRTKLRLDVLSDYEVHAG
jgi:hypothetical protein